MNSQQIEKVLSKCKSFGECLARDELDKIPMESNSDGKSYIINSENHTENGQHWESLRQIDNVLFYFDSFACPPASNIINWANIRGIKTIYYNNVQLQKINENNCGLWCISFVKADIKTLKSFRKFIKSSTYHV